MALNFKAASQSVAETRDRAMRGVCLLALAGNQVVGTISLWPPKADVPTSWYRRPEVASGHQFAVAPERQRQGVGSRILARAEEWAREAGYAELAIDTAIPATHLVAFYTHRGYRQVEVARFTRRNYESVVLSKTLGPAPSAPAVA